jgi:hypothetical protein
MPFYQICLGASGSAGIPPDNGSAADAKKKALDNLALFVRNPDLESYEVVGIAADALTWEGDGGVTQSKEYDVYLLVKYATRNGLPIPPGSPGL